VSELIPTQWKYANIGILCTLINGRAFKPAEWSKNGLPIIRIQNLNNSLAEFNYFDGKLDDKHLVKKGDLLFAWSGTPGTSFGAHIWNNSDGALNQHIFKVELNEKYVNKKYLKYAINYKLEELISKAHGGVGLRHVTKGKFEQTEIPLPPLAEQKEIADRLDKLLAQVGSIKLRLDKIEEIIKSFRQSVIDAMFTCDSECIERSLEDFCSIISGNAFNSNSFIENGIPVIKISNIQHGKFINDPHQEYLPIDYLKIFKKFIVNPEDILLALTRPITNDTLKVCLYPSNGDLALLNQRVAVLRPNGNISKDYLILLMQSNFFKEKIKNNLSETLQPNLSPNDLAKIKIRCPDIYKQNQIVNMIKKQLSIEQCIEQRLKKTQLCINILTQSILSKAFRGELTSEWREKHPELISGENSAVALLERIKEEKNSVKNSVRPLKSAKNVKIALKRK